MLITYRRTGGGFLLLTLAAALVAAVLTVAVGAALLIAGAAIWAVVGLTRALLPASWRRHPESPGAQWPQETIEATVVSPRGSHPHGAG